MSRRNNGDIVERLVGDDKRFGASTDAELVRHAATLHAGVDNAEYLNKVQQHRQAKLLKRVQAEQAKREENAVLVRLARPRKTSKRWKTRDNGKGDLL
jgi:3-methyladenine DNA glycosylase Tag